MAIKVQLFNLVQGMNQDVSPSKRPDKVAYEIKNMRINIGDNNTLMSWSNERGTLELVIKNFDDKDLTYYLRGIILGTCVLNEHLVLFSYINDLEDIIYDIDFSLDPPLGKELYKGNLNFQLGSQFETLGIYENEKILKVYWIDGVNQARFINIVLDRQELLNGSNTLFDFLPTDNIDTRVSVEKIYNSGYFKAGTILYAFTYYNYFGAQTNLFYITPILYVSLKNIGLEVDRLANCSFKLTLTNINPEFNMIRVYSLFRASADTSPQASIVKDIPIVTETVPTEEGGTKVVALDIIFVDDGSTNTSMDVNELLFMNNNRVIPKTMDSKDNTLFLGNFKYDALLDSEIKALLESHDASVAIEFRLELTPIISDSANQYYPYTSQLQFSSDRILGFKGGETYLFGMQLQDCNDRWTSVILVGNVTNEMYPKCIYNELSNSYDVYLVKAYLKPTWLQSVWDTLSGKVAGFKALKMLIVSKTLSQRNILCQGIVCPTVYCYEDRINQTAPYAQSSWFFRPLMKKPPYDYEELLGNDSFSYRANKGGIPEFRHYAALGFAKSAASLNNGEIQSMNYNTGPGLVNLGLLDPIKKDTLANKKDFRHNFGVDSSIITFHSPDIEFNSTIQESVDRMNDLQFSIVGHGKLKDTASKYEVDVEKGTFLSMDNNLFYRTTVNLNQLLLSTKPEVPAASLLSTWGVKTTLYKAEKESDAGYSAESTGKYSYSLLYPWNRSTSVNEQSQPTTGYDWSAPMKVKVMSNLRVCGETKYQTDSLGKIDKSKVWKPINGISQVNIHSDTTKLIKIPNNSNIEYSYYGIIDTVLTNTDYWGYRYIDGEFANNVVSGIQVVPTSYMKPTFNEKDFKVTDNKEESKYFFSDPIRMKYKSSTHAVLAFNSNQGVQEILPQLSLNTAPIYYNITPEWNSGSTGSNLSNITFTQGSLFLIPSIPTEKTSIMFTDYDMNGWSGLDIPRTTYEDDGGTGWESKFEGIVISNADKSTIGELTYANARKVRYIDILRYGEGYYGGSYTDYLFKDTPFTSDCIYYDDQYKLYITESLGGGIYRVVIANKDYMPELLETRADISDTEGSSVLYTVPIELAIEVDAFYANAAELSYTITVVIPDKYQGTSEEVKLFLVHTDKYDGKQQLIEKIVNGHYCRVCIPIKYINGTTNLTWEIDKDAIYTDGVTVFKYYEDYSESEIGSCFMELIPVLEYQGGDTSSERYRLSYYDTEENDDGIFYIAELKSKNGSLDTSVYNLQNYQWLAASDVIVEGLDNVALFGDTYFLRYDCLKTYPYTDEDPNQIVDIASVMIETYMNIDGRYDRNRGMFDNNNINNTNFNLINKAYTQPDRFVQSYVNDKQYDVTRFPNSIMWSLTKVFGLDIDAWTHLTSTSVLDLEGNLGELTKILNFLNSLIFFQTDGAGYIKYNENAALAASTGVPVELANSGKVDGKLYLNTEIGCQNKDTIAVSKNAVYFIDGNTHTIYQIKSPQQLLAPTPISDNSFEVFMNALDISTAKTFCNRKTQDIYFIFNNTSYPCLTWNETLNGFSSFYDYRPNFLNSIGDKLYHILNESIDDLDKVSIWILNAGDFNMFYYHLPLDETEEDILNNYSPFYMTVVANGGEALLDKIWNNLDFRADSWSPEGSLLSSTFDLLDVWNEYLEGTIALQTLGKELYKGAYHTSVDMPSTLKKKFRIWRTLFPRAKGITPNLFIKGWERTIPDIPDPEGDAYIPYGEMIRSRDRIRNPWTYIKLTMNTPNKNRTVLHDLNVYYYQ